MVAQRSTHKNLGRSARKQLWLSGLAGFAALSLAQVANAETLDFESLAPGETVERIGCVSFSHHEAGIRLVAANGLGATSGRRYLGASHAQAATLLAGDAISLTFDSPVQSLSLAILTTPSAPPAAFELETPAGSVTSASSIPVDLGPDQIHSLSLSASEPFSTATIRSTEGVFAFHIDDLEFEPVPEPANMLLFGIGLLSLTARRSLRGRRVDHPTSGDPR